MFYLREELIFRHKNSLVTGFTLWQVFVGGGGKPGNYADGGPCPPMGKPWVSFSMKIQAMEEDRVFLHENQ